MSLVAFTTWLRTEGKSDGTIKVYLNAMNSLIEWYEEKEGREFRPAEVTTLHLHEFYNQLDKVEKKSPAMINKMMSGVKTFFKFTMETAITIYNPTAKIKIKRTNEQNASPKWMTKHEQMKFYHAIYQQKVWILSRDVAMCRLMSGAGLRVQEIADLLVTDICLEKRKEMVTVRGGKGGKFRQVPLNADCIEALKAWIEERGKGRQLLDESPSLFLSERGSDIAVRTVQYMVTKYAEKAKLPDISAHSLRHTFCKNLVDRDVSLQQIAFLAGHDDLETTRRYTISSEPDTRQAVEKISEIKFREEKEKVDD